MMEKKIEVKDLTISFRTVNGKVQAVRDISFDLFKGETLAIVGESGSGKSVTSRAILGISAGNAMIEGGEILYDGKDLLKISEEDFHKIRGDKIAMVFQDPLSSLNPIMKIGRQLTEAMILKNKAHRRECRAEVKELSRILSASIDAAGNASGSGKEGFATFHKIVAKQLELETAYSEAHENADSALGAAKDLLLEIEKDAITDLIAEAKEMKACAQKAYNHFVVSGSDAAAMKTALSALLPACRQAKKSKDYAKVTEILSGIEAVLARAMAEETKPDFFALAYYLIKKENKIPELPVAELNRQNEVVLTEGFMDAFEESALAGVRYAADKAVEKQQAAIALLDKLMPAFDKKDLDKKECKQAAAALARAVKDSIDRLETVKDSRLYTFGVSFQSAVDAYFDGIEKNKKEQARFAKQTKKYDSLAARGKAPEWKVAPLSLIDLELARENILKIAAETRARMESRIEAAPSVNYRARVDALTDYLREISSGSAHKVTRSSAKTQAIKLMESVGISEPRKRYNQYPFEFSGGMRQRIVIAISLTANPDILICDEPTTALDVTIQAQILELINKLKRERNLSVIFITHDLGVVANMADRIAVMYAGKIVECGTSEDVFYSPAHPYTWALLSSIPDLDTNDRLESIPGTPPNMIYPPKGDAFAARNKYAMEIDFEEQPPLFQISDTHYAATWLQHPSAPKVEPPKIVTDRIARMRKTGGSNNEQ